MENPIKMDDLGVHIFLETPIFMTIASLGAMGTHFSFSAKGHIHPYFEALNSYLSRLHSGWVW